MDTNEAVRKAIKLIADPAETYDYLDSRQCGVAKLYKAVTGEDPTERELSTYAQSSNHEFARVLAEVNERLGIDTYDRSGPWWVLSEQIGEASDDHPNDERFAATQVLVKALV